MRKLVLVSLVIVLVLSLVACGESSPNPKPLSEGEINEMLTNADSFKGRIVEKLPVEVFNIISEESENYQYQGWADDNSDKSVLFVSNENLHLKSGDYILLTGTIVGKHKGENAFGGTVTASIIQVTEIEKADVTIFNPAQKTIEINSTQEQHGLTVTLQKVEIAEKSTRVYLDITNNSGTGVRIYSFNSYVLQGSTQLDGSAISYEEETLKSNMVNGSEQSGLLSFEPASLDGGPIKVSLDVSSDDWNINFSEFIFDIPLD